MRNRALLLLPLALTLGCTGEVITETEPEVPEPTVVEVEPSGPSPEAPPQGACGDIDYTGACEGSTAVWCERDALIRVDCAAQGQGCGFLDPNTGYYCMDAAGVDVTLRGHAQYEDRVPLQTGLGPVTNQPIRRAVVVVNDANTGAEYGGTQTDDSGDFTVVANAPEGAALEVTVLAYNADEGVGVFDCPDFEGCEPAIHGIVRAAPDGTDVDLGTLTASASEVGPAFNALDVALVGVGQAELAFGGDAPLLALMWERGKALECKSCFGGVDDPDDYSVVFLSGDPADDDAYDDFVILHELGHFFDFVWSHSDNPGETHDGSPADPRLAWGEGLATYLGCRIAGVPVLVDTNPVGAGFYAIDEPEFPARRNDGVEQDLSEFVVSATLWQLDQGVDGFPGAGPTPINTVLQGFLGDAQARTDRGVEGVDLVDFIDGWRCLDLGAAGVLEEVVEQTQRFPYDFDDEVCP